MTPWLEAAAWLVGTPLAVLALCILGGVLESLSNRD